MVTFTPVTDLDPNVFYHVSEGRVDSLHNASLTSGLITLPDGDLRLGPYDDNSLWQFQRVGGRPGRYQIRQSGGDAARQVGVCVRADEDAQGGTRACMQDSSGSLAQRWDVGDWGDGTYRLMNAANGTKYWLDVHVNGPLFMDNDIDTSVEHVAQHWLMTSAKDIKDDAYSTTFSATEPVTTITTDGTTRTIYSTSSGSPTSTSNPSSSTSSSPSSSGTHSLSAGAKAGIGIGAALGAIAIALVAFFFWRRRRLSNRSNTQGIPVTEFGGGAWVDSSATPSSFRKSPASQAAWTAYSTSPDQYAQQYQQQGYGPQQQQQYEQQYAQQYGLQPQGQLPHQQHPILPHEMPTEGHMRMELDSQPLYQTP